MKKFKNLTACLISLCLVLSVILIVPSANAEEIPPYDYTSFIGNWYDTYHDMTLEVNSINDNYITFYIPALFPAEYTYPIVNNQVTWSEHSAGIDFEKILTFYDDSIYYASISGEDKFECWFTSETTKPRKFEVGNYPVTLNGKQLEFDQPPVMCGNRILVPLRKVFEEMGAEVYYDIETAYYTDGNIININIIKNYIECVSLMKLPDENSWHLQTGNLTDNQSYKSIDLDVQPITLNGRTLVPVRALSEALGGEVLWDGDTQTVTINCPIATSRRSIEEIEQVQQFTFEKALEFVKQQYFVPELGYDLNSIQGEFVMPVDHADNFILDEKGKCYGFLLWNSEYGNIGVLNVYHDGTITQR